MVIVMNEETLKDILIMLDLFNVSNNEAQMNALKMSTEFEEDNEYIYYLSHILCNMDNLESNVRSLAAFLLKGQICSWKIHDDSVLEYTLELLSKNLDIKPNNLQIAISGMISKFIKINGLRKLPGFLEHLWNCLNSPQSDEELVSLFTVVADLCEDSINQLCVPENSQFVDFIVKKCISEFQSASEEIRLKALFCTEKLLYAQNTVIFTNIDEFARIVFSMFTDESLKVRKSLCSMIVALQSCHMSIIVQYMEPIVAFLLGSLRCEIGVDSCEFWGSIYLWNETARSALWPFVGGVCCALLDHMCYSEAELNNILIAERDDQVAPKLGDWSDEDNQDDLYYDDETGWTIRKAASRSLDCISVVFPGQILPIILPKIQPMLSSNNFLHQEAAILAIGAVSEGSSNTIIAHLPVIMPYLLNCLTHDNFIVRSITCWTISRYVPLIFLVSPSEFLASLIEQTLSNILDSHYRVQYAACSLFATIVENAGSQMSPFLDRIMNVCSVALQHYKKKSIVHLYDVIIVLFDVIGYKIRVQVYVDALFPLLLGRFDTSLRDESLIPLFDCVNRVLSCVGSLARAYCGSVVLYVYQVLLSRMETYSADEEVNWDLLCGAMDLITTSVSSMRAPCELFADSSLISLLFNFLNVEDDSNMSVFAPGSYLISLIGEVSVRNPSAVIPIYGKIMEFLLPSLVDGSLNLKNNAVCALGRLAVSCGGFPGEYLSTCLTGLLGCFSDGRQLLRQNVAATMGQIALVYPVEISEHVESYLGQWCSLLCGLTDLQKKEEALNGMILAVKVRPRVLLGCFETFCEAVCFEGSNEFVKTVIMFFGEYKGFVGGEMWRVLMDRLSEGLIGRLTRLFGMGIFVK